MVTYIKCFGVIREGANEQKSLEPYYRKVLYSVSKSWTGAYDKRKHNENFFAILPNGVKFDSENFDSSYILCDKIAVSILANCSIVHTVEL